MIYINKTTLAEIYERIKKVRTRISVKMEEFGHYKCKSESKDEWYEGFCGIDDDGKKYANCGCIGCSYGKMCKHLCTFVLYHIFLAHMRDKDPQRFAEIIDDIEGSWPEVQQLMVQVIGDLCENT